MNPRSTPAVRLLRPFRPRLFRLALCGLVCGLAAVARADDDPLMGIVQKAPQEIAPLKTSFPMPELKRPQFPDRTFDIREYGAVPGGERKCTGAIARAVAACAEAGGGRVLVPRGEWLTGPIHLKSNVNLHLADGAKVRFSQEYEDYLPVVLIQRGGVRCYNYSPLIYARECQNVAVTGEGDALLDGQGKRWWPWKKRQPGMEWLLSTAGCSAPLEKRVFGTTEQGVRPPFVQFYACKNVLMEGFTITNSPSWTLHPVYCENLIARRLKVLSYGIPNGDGIDPDSCKNVLIEYCYFDTGDDCVILKAGRNEDAWQVGIPCENIVVRHCTMRHGHAAVGVGSEMSAGVRNVLAHDLVVNGCQRAIYLKTQPGRGGAIENVHVHDVEVQAVGSYAILLNMRYSGPAKAAPHAPAMRDICIERLRCQKAKQAIGLGGLENSPIEKVTLADLDIRAQSGVRCRVARNIEFRRVNIETENSPVLLTEDSQDVTIAECRCPKGVETFFMADSGSRAIRLETNDLSGAKTPVQRAEGVPADAVTIAGDAK